MTRFLAILLTAYLSVMGGVAQAEHEAAGEAQPVSTEEAPAPAPPAVSEATPPAAAVPAPALDNLEFVSGQVNAIDETAKTVTVKLYGETEDEASQKVLTVTLDENTDITDGERDRDLKSLAAGTEIDVEYDPTSNKATYIFVY